MEYQFGSLLVSFAFYFTPSLLAIYLQHKNVPAIIATNLFLGWTVIGWFIAFIWAVKRD